MAGIKKLAEEFEKTGRPIVVRKAKFGKGRVVSTLAGKGKKFEKLAEKAGK